MLFEQLNPHACRTYLIGPSTGGDVLLVDPVLDHLEDYRTLLETRKLTLRSVMDTHTHGDHISGAAALRDVTGCEFILHRSAPAGCATVRVEDGDMLSLFEGVSMEVLYTPGHTGDSICLLLKDRILTGDTLFLDDAGAGRDDLPGGDAGAHWESLERIKTLPDTLTVYPAHEYRNREPSTLGRQRQTNPHLTGRTREEFVHYLQDMRLGPADWMKDVLKANYACARNPQAAWVPSDSPACEVKGTLDGNVNAIAVSTVTPQQLSVWLQSKPPPLLLDVREPYELEGPEGSMPGVLNISIDVLAHRLDEIVLVPSQPLVTICHSGARGHTAAQILTSHGLSPVYVLEGGMVRWRQRKEA